ncbi:MAG TPA: hypothetical protein VK789_20840 [Bryobacteraceae bacterium]|jgi:hypothetical protein|nr:hypothetical protein [Bryobacteraceae bacterium]
MAEHTNGPEEHGQDPNPGVSHERRDINVFQVTAFGIGLLLSCIVVVFAMWAMFDFFYAREDAKNASNPSALMLNERQKLPPEPRLQAEPKVELKDLRADEEAILTSYGWVDPNKGVVRIPIDQAIDIVAQKGLPSKPSPAGLDNEGYRMIPEDSSSGRTLEKISR